MLPLKFFKPNFQTHDDEMEMFEEVSSWNISGPTFHCGMILFGIE